MGHLPLPEVDFSTLIEGDGPQIPALPFQIQLIDLRLQDWSDDGAPLVRAQESRCVAAKPPATLPDRKMLDEFHDYHHNVIHLMLGEFEYVLITAAACLGENAYGAAIREEIERATRRKCSIGALYTTIERLETKGLLKTWMGEATPQRGGRAKRMVRVTPRGLRSASEFYEAMIRVSRNAAWAVNKPEDAS